MDEQVLKWRAIMCATGVVIWWLAWSLLLWLPYPREFSNPFLRAGSAITTVLLLALAVFGFVMVGRAWWVKRQVVSDFAAIFGKQA